MTIEKLKMAVQNMNAYLEECHDESDTITLTAKVLKSIKENYEELIKLKECTHRKGEEWERNGLDRKRFIENDADKP